jgi:hypothetical protein
MIRTAVFVTMAFLVGLGIGYFARGARAAMLERRSGRAADLAAIEKLHQEDIAVTLSQDPKGLIDLWTEDAVRFNAAGVPAVGKQAIGAENEAVHSQFPGFKVLSYAAKYGNAQIEDGLACEWGEHTGEYKCLQKLRRPVSPSKDSTC